MNKGMKLFIAAVYAVVLTACQAEEEKKEDIAINTGLILQEVMEKQKEKEILPVHSGYIGDSSWENEKQLLVEYRDAAIPEEYQNEFYVETVGEKIIYRFTNKGESPFKWLITTYDQQIWNNGQLAPGQSKTYTAEYKEGYMPKGLYTFSIVSSAGEESVFDFVLSAPE
jgi:hypothetical protein